MSPTRQERGRRTVVTVVLAVVVLTMAGVTFVSSVATDGDEVVEDEVTTTTIDTASAAEARAWSDRVGEAFSPALQSFQDFAADVETTAKGELEADTAMRRMEGYVRIFAEVRDTVRSVPPLALDPRIHDLYLGSAHLYVEAARIAHSLAALSGEAPDVREQARRLVERTRVLAARVFDRGRVLLRELAPDAPVEGVTIKESEEVPSWVDERLAAGPPLDSPPADTDDPFPLRQKRRPQQDRDDWVEAVRRALVPDAADLVAAMEAGRTAELKALARAYVAAAERLRREPDPEDDREGSARLRLGLLLEADAARAAQLSTLVANPGVADHLVASGQRLALVARPLFPADLPFGAAGLDASLLDASGP